MDEHKITQIAEMCHEANKVLCEQYGDFTQYSWPGAQQWQRDSAIEGVKYALDNPNATPENQHEAWSAAKETTGWVYGDVKDAVAKTHPCLVPYAELPEFQKTKDKLFQAIVKAMV